VADVISLLHAQGLNASNVFHLYNFCLPGAYQMALKAFLCNLLHVISWIDNYYAKYAKTQCIPKHAICYGTWQLF